MDSPTTEKVMVPMLLPGGRNPSWRRDYIPNHISRKPEKILNELIEGVMDVKHSISLTAALAARQTSEPTVSPPVEEMASRFDVVTMVASGVPVVNLEMDKGAISNFPATLPLNITGSASEAEPADSDDDSNLPDLEPSVPMESLPRSAHSRKSAMLSIPRWATKDRLVAFNEDCLRALHTPSSDAEQQTLEPATNNVTSDIVTGIDAVTLDPGDDDHKFSGMDNADIVEAQDRQKKRMAAWYNAPQRSKEMDAFFKLAASGVPMVNLEMDKGAISNSPATTSVLPIPDDDNLEENGDESDLPDLEPSAPVDIPPRKSAMLAIPSWVTLNTEAGKAIRAEILRERNEYGEPVHSPTL